MKQIRSPWKSGLLNQPRTLQARFWLRQSELTRSPCSLPAQTGSILSLPSLHRGGAWGCSSGDRASAGPPCQLLVSPHVLFAQHRVPHEGKHGRSRNEGKQRLVQPHSLPLW